MCYIQIEQFKIGVNTGNIGGHSHYENDLC